MLEAILWSAWEDLSSQPSFPEDTSLLKGPWHPLPVPYATKTDAESRIFPNLKCCSVAVTDTVHQPHCIEASQTTAALSLRI